MPKTFLQDEKLIFTNIFYSDEAKTIPVNPGTIVFEVKKPDGTVDDTTVVVSNGGTGYWKAEYVVDQYGTWEWRWKTENPRIVAQGEFWVIKDNVE
jgi:hypothetical protein